MPILVKWIPILAWCPSRRSPKPISSQNSSSHPQASISRESLSFAYCMWAWPRYVHLQTVVQRLRVSSPVALKNSHKLIQIQQDSNTKLTLNIKKTWEIEYLYDNQSLKSIHLKTINQDSCKFSLTHRSWKVRLHQYRFAKAIIESIKGVSYSKLKIKVQHTISCST